MDKIVRRFFQGCGWALKIRCWTKNGAIQKKYPPGINRSGYKVAFYFDSKIITLVEEHQLFGPGPVVAYSFPVLEVPGLLLLLSLYQKSGARTA